MQPFFEKTTAQFIDAPKTPFPVNPLSFIDSINDVNKQMGIDKFVDIICKYSNIGIKQRGKLREATSEAFISKKPGEYLVMVGRFFFRLFCFFCCEDEVI